jgi:hypothetical protein
MYAPYRSIRKNYSKIDLEIRFLLDRPGHCFQVANPVFGVNTVREGL